MLRQLYKYYRYKSPLDPELVNLSDEQVKLLTANMIVDLRMKKIQEVEERYRRFTSDTVRGNTVGSKKGKPLRVSTTTFGEDSFYTIEEINEILEDQDISDITGMASSDDGEELKELFGGD